MKLVIPPLFENRRALIRWENPPTGAPCRLERILDTSFDAPHEGLPWNERDARNETFAQYDSKARSWSALDALDTTATLFVGEAHCFEDLIPANTATAQYRLTVGSDVLKSEVHAITRNSPPEISVSGLPLGRKYKPFFVSFTVTDPFPDSLLSLTAVLGEKTLLSLSEQPAPLLGAVGIEQDTLDTLAPGSSYEIVLTACDEAGLTSSFQCPFTVVDEPHAYAAFYLLRDGRPLAKITEGYSFTDYTAVGEHRYRIRGVEQNGSYCDSNEITLTTAMQATTLAPKSRPQDALSLTLRRGELPTHRGNYQRQRRLYYFQGRDYAAAEDSGAACATLSVSYSVRSRQEYDRLVSLAQSGEPLWYRDEVGGCALVLIDSMPTAFSLLSCDFTLEMTRLSAVEDISYD